MFDRGLVEAIQRAAMRQVWLNHERMPAEIERGRLVLAEETISTLLPVPLRGRPDAVYLTPDSQLVPVETKVRDRARVKLGDIVQLSAYRVMLEGAGFGKQYVATVAQHGYVRLVLNGRPTYCMVPLFDQVFVTLLWAAYWRRKA